MPHWIHHLTVASWVEVSSVLQTGAESVSAAVGACSMPCLQVIKVLSKDLLHHSRFQAAPIPNRFRECHLISWAKNNANATMMKDITKDIIVSVTMVSDANSSSVEVYPGGLVMLLYSCKALHSRHVLLTTTF